MSRRQAADAEGFWFLVYPRGGMGAVALLLMFAGGVTLGYGMRGERVGHDLRCPDERCNYPLRAIADANAQRRPPAYGEHNLPTLAAFPVTCPECGRVIARAKDAARGEARRYPVAVAVGAAVLLAGAAMAVWIVFESVAPGAAGAVRGVVGM